MKMTESTIHGAQAFGVTVGLVLKLVDAPTWTYFVALGVFALFWLASSAVESAQEIR